MTIEYVLLLICVFMFTVKVFVSGPKEAFKDSGPRLGARIEQQLATGSGFKPSAGQDLAWKSDQ
ncbi:MAG: hypothetical protein ACOYOK_05845 [Pseudobdellovibrionaceae bacterium]